MNDDPAALVVTSTMIGPKAVTLEVSGELDVATVDQFGLAVDLSLAQPGIRRVTLDLGRLRFLDSAGIARLVAARSAAHYTGARFVVINATGMVRRVLEVTGTYRELTDETG